MRFEITSAINTIRIRQDLNAYYRIAPTHTQTRTHTNTGITRQTTRKPKHSCTHPKEHPAPPPQKPPAPRTEKDPGPQKPINQHNVLCSLLSYVMRPPMSCECECDVNGWGHSSRVHAAFLAYDFVCASSPSPSPSSSLSLIRFPAVRVSVCPLCLRGSVVAARTPPRYRPRNSTSASTTYPAHPSAFREKDEAVAVATTTALSPRPHQNIQPHLGRVIYVNVFFVLLMYCPRLTCDCVLIFPRLISTGRGGESTHNPPTIESPLSSPPSNNISTLKPHSNANIRIWWPRLAHCPPRPPPQYVSVCSDVSCLCK